MILISCYLWKVNDPRFKVLFEMACNVLTILTSSVALECAFSTGGIFLIHLGVHLLKNFASSYCLQDWYQSEPFSVNIEEYFEGPYANLILG